MICIG
jgi:hypothetical protein